MSAVDALARSADAGNVEVMTAALAVLAEGGTPRAVAAELHRFGLAGDRACSGDCPVALYLSMFTGSDVLVGGHTAAVWTHDQGWVDVALPEPVASFVAYYDGGQFPELVR